MTAAYLADAALWIAAGIAVGMCLRPLVDWMDRSLS